MWESGFSLSLHNNTTINKLNMYHGYSRINGLKNGICLIECVTTSDEIGSYNNYGHLGVISTSWEDDCRSPNEALELLLQMANDYVIRSHRSLANKQLTDNELIKHFNKIEHDYCYALAGVRFESLHCGVQDGRGLIKGIAYGTLVRTEDPYAR